MKKAIQEYIELKDIEKEALWNEAFFVFDTNVFLNLYRYSKNLFHFFIIKFITNLSIK